MNERQLNQNIDVQLDQKSDKLRRITGYELQDALKRTTHLKNADKGKLTWVDFTSRPRYLENVSFEQF
jgi:hypothetical protein